MSATIEEHLEVVAGPLRAAGLEVRSQRERSTTSRVAEVIASVLAKQPAGIAVVASHGRGGVLRRERGSRAEKVLDQSPCPILIVRAGTTATEPADISAPVARDAGSP